MISPRPVLRSAVTASRLLIAALLLLSLSSCRAEVPAVQRPITIDDVELSDLLAKPDKLNQVKIRVKGIARIEFEGNSLYPDREAFMSSESKKGVWLGLGWPIEDDVLALNGREVVVEGTFDAWSFGHEGAYVGTIGKIIRIGAAP